MKSDTDVGPEGLAYSSQRCSVELRSGLCEDQSRCSIPNSPHPCLTDLALCIGAQSCWKRNFLFCCYTKIMSALISRFDHHCMFCPGGELELYCNMLSAALFPHMTREKQCKQGYKSPLQMTLLI